MAFGILESSLVAPPGTSYLESCNGTSDNVHVILVPQPSRSPQDPLNWSRLRKELFFATVVFGSILTGVMGPVLVPGFTIVASSFGVGLTEISLLNGSLIMGLGVSTLICAAIAPIYGKRLIYLFTTFLTIVSCIWAAASQSYTSLLVSRVFQGLSMGGFFGLSGTITINDVWFVHERGIRVGLWNMASIASISIAPVISGYLITDLGWRWSFWMLAICYGVALAMVVVFMPETSFDRPGSEAVPELSFIEVNSSSQGASDPKDAEKSLRVSSADQGYGTATVTPTLWRRMLGLGNFQIKGQRRVFTNLAAPFMLLRAPAVVWSCAMWSVCFTWLIIQASIGQQVFGAPPYNMDSIHVGIFVGSAPLAGAILGTLFAGVMSDWIVKSLAMRNQGVYEPEFRLLIMIPFLVTWCVGIFGLGAALSNELSVVVCGTFLAILNFAVGVGCTGIVSYTNDVCRKHAAESFGITMLIKSAFAFGLTFMLNDYYSRAGPMKFMATWGSLCVAVTAFTIPMYIFGKKSRAWTHRHNIL